jgi:cystathionine beta-lyase/cystathionine gamma-synthase
MHSDEFGFSTLLSHFGEEEKPEGAVVPPIFQNSLFVFDTAEELLASMQLNPTGKPYHYSRLANPTLDIVEQKLAKLEKTEACKVLGCGMAALTTALINSLRQGAHMVVVDTGYGPVRTTLARYLERFGVSMTLVDGRDPSEVIDAFKPETSVVYLESPSSILFRLQDLDAITKETKARNITTVFDNTYNTPLHFTPAEHGIDLVCHSATKYLGGHSDITAGVICGTKDRIVDLTKNELNVFGNILHPFQAWLLNRGLRTLKVRMKAHEETGNLVAGYLENRPEVAKVHHVGLDSYEQRDLFRKHYRGSGGLFSFEPKVQERERVMAFCNELKLFGRGISWGGFESLVVPIHVKPSDHDEARWVIRLYTGLEEPEDLLKDVERALAHLAV